MICVAHVLCECLSCNLLHMGAPLVPHAQALAPLAAAAVVPKLVATWWWWVPPTAPTRLTPRCVARGAWIGRWWWGCPTPSSALPSWACTCQD